MGNLENLQKIENLADDLVYYWGLLPIEQQVKIREEYFQLVKTIEDIQDYLTNNLSQ
jgi:hypothetical protein